MANNNPFDTYHVTPISYDRDGYPTAEAPFTQTSDTKRHAVIVPPEKVIPVILVPGIMGSNLKLKKLPEGFSEKRFTDGVKPDPWSFPPVKRTTTGWGDKAWCPDDGVTFMAQRFWSLTAYERRLLLDPDNTEVDDRAEVDPKLALKQNFVFESSGDGKQKKDIANQRKRGFLAEMKRRGWSTVMQGSYVEMLAYLEYHLNRMFYVGELNDFWQQNIIGRSQSQNSWGMLKGAKPLTRDEVKKAARYWFPVHAAGYNWVQSNKDSAQHVLRKINEFTDHYKKMGLECEKVILVTHSMGGLVARGAVHPDIGQNIGAADKILGVIHGVMPTHGAAAAYRRCHAGFEGASIGRGFNPVSRILGKDGPQVAAIFSNSPGALQLLPNKLYGPGWLRIEMPDGTRKSLPEADPYKEIYEQKDVWWRLMNPEWVNPAPDLSKDERLASWGQYLDALGKASRFHDKLGASHHPHTCVQYSADSKSHKAFGSLTWKHAGGPYSGVANPANHTRFSETESGEVTLDGISNGHTLPPRFVLSDQDEAGDGTVPVRSARALDSTVEIAAAHNPGYDHQDSYTDPRARELTAYAIVRMVAAYMP